MGHRFQKGFWRRIPVVIIATIGICGAIFACDIYCYSFVSDRNPADAAIVLGAEVWDERPSPVFEERIKHAVHLYQTKQVKMIIFTGGVGENDRVAESAAAKAYALEAGVAEKDIRCETKSKVTAENLRGAKEVMKSIGVKRVLIVSDPFHMRRSVRMAQDFGMNAYPSPTPTTRYRSFLPRMEFLLRETYFFGMYIVQRLFRILP